MAKINQSEVAEFIQSVTILKVKLNEKLPEIKEKFKDESKVPVFGAELTEISLQVVTAFNAMVTNNPNFISEDMDLKSSVYMMDHNTLVFRDNLPAYNQRLEDKDENELIFNIAKNSISRALSSTDDNMNKLEQFSEQVKTKCNQMNDAHAQEVRAHHREEAECGNI